MNLFLLSFAALAIYLALAWFLSWREVPRNRDLLRRWRL